MKMTLLAAAAAAMLAGHGFAQGSDDGSGQEEMSVGFEDVQWEDTIVPGFRMALAWRNDDGRESWLFIMEPGTDVPMHRHTNDYWGTTIQGTWVHLHDDGTEVVSSSGSYALVKGGENHGDRCDGDEVCIGLLNYDGPRDVLRPE